MRESDLGLLRRLVAKILVRSNEILAYNFLAEFRLRIEDNVQAEIIKEFSEYPFCLKIYFPYLIQNFFGIKWPNVYYAKKIEKKLLLFGESQIKSMDNNFMISNF